MRPALPWSSPATGISGIERCRVCVENRPGSAYVSPHEENQPARRAHSLPLRRLPSLPPTRACRNVGVLSIFKTLATRNADRSAARQSRILRWDQPLTGKRQRLRAWLNMLFIDHGIIRLVYVNEHSVTPDFSRSAQPAPHDIRRLASAGLRTCLLYTSPSPRDRG